MNVGIRWCHECYTSLCHNVTQVVTWPITSYGILVPRGRAPFGQHQESRPLAWPLARPNTGSPRFKDFPSLCACSESSLTNLIGSGLNLLCLQSDSKTECRWTGPEVVILGADQKERGLWVRECSYGGSPALRAPINRFICQEKLVSFQY